MFDFNLIPTFQPSIKFNKESLDSTGANIEIQVRRLLKKDWFYRY